MQCMERDVHCWRQDGVKFESELQPEGNQVTFTLPEVFWMIDRTMSGHATGGVQRLAEWVRPVAFELVMKATSSLDLAVSILGVASHEGRFASELGARAFRQELEAHALDEWHRGDDAPQFMAQAEATLPDLVGLGLQAKHDYYSIKEMLEGPVFAPGPDTVFGIGEYEFDADDPAAELVLDTTRHMVVTREYLFRGMGIDIDNWPSA